MPLAARHAANRMSIGPLPACLAKAVTHQHPCAPVQLPGHCSTSLPAIATCSLPGRSLMSSGGPQTPPLHMSQNLTVWSPGPLPCCMSPVQARLLTRRCAPRSSSSLAPSAGATHRRAATSRRRWSAASPHSFVMTFITAWALAHLLSMPSWYAWCRFCGEQIHLQAVSSRSRLTQV